MDITEDFARKLAIHYVHPEIVNMKFTWNDAHRRQYKKKSIE